MCTTPRSPRLRYRLYDAADLPLVQALFADPQASRFYPDQASAAGAARWIDWSRRLHDTHGFGLWALEDAQTGEFVGDAGLSLQPVEGRRWLEVGYHLVAVRRGQGLATEAAQACLAWAWAHTGHDRVCSIVDPANLASLRVARRVHLYECAIGSPRGPRRLCFSWPAERSAARAA